MKVARMPVPVRTAICQGLRSGIISQQPLCLTVSPEREPCWLRPYQPK
jgi:hypothetical protein